MTGANAGKTRFGNLLRELRTRAGLNQAELAARAGLSQRGVSDLERGLKERPHFESVRRLADALALSKDDRSALIAAARPVPVEPAATRLRLPVPATPFFGRAEEIASIRSLLGERGARLVTLTGPGGVGKTRLALRVATEIAGVFADGVAFAGLAAITDPALVPSTIVKALGLREAMGRSPETHLHDELRDRELLLVVDNLEHVADAAPLFADLLADCPRLKILATSRARLRLYGEHEFPVPPLGRPEFRQSLAHEDLVRDEAIRFFAGCATAVSPAFRLTAENVQAVATICDRVDGLPLAIELAAARTRIFPLDELIRQLGAPLDLLTGGARDLPARHQTMRDAVAWSYALLPADQQRLFRQVSVFTGGFTIEAATRLTGDASVLRGIEDLRDHSLLQVAARDSGEMRFELLETIREFGLDELGNRGEAGSVRQRHLDYVLDLAEQANPWLAGTAQTETGSTGANQEIWLARLDRDHDNLRAALGWAVAHDPSAALRLGGALWKFWIFRGHLSEGRDWLDRILRASAGIETIAKVRALNGGGHLAGIFGDQAACFARHEASMTLARKLGDRRGVALALNDLGGVPFIRDDFDRAEAHCREALSIYRELGDRQGIAEAKLNLCEIAVARGRWHEAMELGDDVVGHCRTTGDTILLANAIGYLALASRKTGDLPRATALYRESLTVTRELGFQIGLGWSLSGTGGLLVDRGQSSDGVCLLAAMDALYKDLNADIQGGVRTVFTEDVARARDVLGEATFASAWESGTRLSLDEAADVALTILASIN